MENELTNIDRTIVFLGDSHGWGQGANDWERYAMNPAMPLKGVRSFTNRLQLFLYEEGYKNFINSSVGGWSTLEAKNNLNEKVLNFNPQITFIQYGINDWKNNNYVDILDFEKNLSEIITVLKGNNIIPILIVPLPILLEEKYADLFKGINFFDEKNYTKKYTDYINIIRKFSSSIDVIDTWEYFMNNSYEQYLSDCIHPNQLGHDLYFLSIKNYLYNYIL